MFKKTSRSFAFVLVLALIAPATRMFAQSGVVSGGDPQPKGDAVSTVTVVLTTLATM